ncbi:hypothetical protein IEQ34_000545 [Dendrobium chrysotoxum]|uniref:Uncharacterized protein n=1 Tax=Dendrobium chrysotoxum TaxID=161865 RepID=A0AAV7HT97_DENCH|nr:hypothetical protein IEQ34_000545 [Dendrobium chrysotoxum]
MPAAPAARPLVRKPGAQEKRKDGSEIGNEGVEPSVERRERTSTPSSPGLLMRAKGFSGKTPQGAEGGVARGRVVSGGDVVGVAVNPEVAAAEVDDEVEGNGRSALVEAREVLKRLGVFGERGDEGLRASGRGKGGEEDDGKKEDDARCHFWPFGRREKGVEI